LAADGAEPVEGRTRLQKLLFLIQMRADEMDMELFDMYDFIAYDYGPFSKNIYDDIEYLDQRGFLRETPKQLDDGVIKYDYEITPKGKKYLRSEVEQSSDIIGLINSVKSDFNDADLKNFIEYVYSEYPEYAENSVLF
jgi:uncharacterized protein YwgA